MSAEVPGPVAAAREVAELLEGYPPFDSMSDTRRAAALGTAAPAARRATPRRGRLGHAATGPELVR